MQFSTNPDSNIKMDALIYAEIENQINDTTELQNLVTSIGITSSNFNDIKSKLNNYLSNTTIKRACCMNRAGAPNIANSTGVKVKEVSCTEAKDTKTCGISL